MATNPRKDKVSNEYKRRHERLVRLFNSYVDTGVVDLSAKSSHRDEAMLESVEFERLLIAWHDNMEERGLAKSTRDSYGYLANKYMLYLERDGIHTVSQADTSTVLSFLCSLENSTWAKTSMYTAITNLRPFLAFCGREDLVGAVNMAGAKRQHSIVPDVDRSDEQKVVDACLNGVVSARDASMTLLALQTGIRASDILALKVGDIGWRSGKINIVQQKTGNPLTLPLTAPVGNAMCRYLLEERPSADDDHLFLRSRAPYTALGTHGAVYCIISATFCKAGSKTRQAGTRLLRHNAATRMVEGGTPLPTVSALLGHADPNSANTYIGVDRKRMLLCVLPLPEGVFS